MYILSFEKNLWFNFERLQGPCHEIFDVFLFFFRGVAFYKVWILIWNFWNFFFLRFSRWFCMFFGMTVLFSFFKVLSKCSVRERTILILPSKSKDAGIDQLELHRAIEWLSTKLHPKLDRYFFSTYDVSTKMCVH